MNRYCLHSGPVLWRYRAVGEGHAFHIGFESNVRTFWCRSRLCRKCGRSATTNGGRWLQTWHRSAPKSRALIERARVLFKSTQNLIARSHHLAHNARNSRTDWRQIGTAPLRRAARGRLGGGRLLDCDGENCVGRSGLDRESELPAGNLVGIYGRTGGLLNAVRLAKARNHFASGGRQRLVERDIDEGAFGRALYAGGAALDFGDRAI